MITNKKINEILSQVRSKHEDAIAVRIIDDYYEEYGLQIGDKLGVSSIWIDGDYTHDRLDGVSAIDVESKLQDVVYRGYLGKKIFVLSGYIEGYGEDEGEVIVKDAEIIDIINL